VTALAESRANSDEVVSVVQDFYRQALPPLGWVFVHSKNFTRGGERLTFNFKRNGKRTIMQVHVVPLPIK
jgi:hypothetical protein